MSKPYHEPPADYLVYCRDAIKTEQDFINTLERRKDDHTKESNTASHSDCSLCELLDNVLNDQWGLLTIFNERYLQARKGIYE